MPAPEISELYQPAVLWEWAGYDDYGLSTILDQPKQIMVRADSQGTEDSEESAVVFDQEVWAGSVIKLGRVEDLPPGTDLSEEDESLMEVISTSSTPDLKARNWRRDGKLRFYRGSLPNFQPPRGNG